MLPAAYNENIYNKSLFIFLISKQNKEHREKQNFQYSLQNNFWIDKNYKC